MSKVATPFRERTVPAEHVLGMADRLDPDEYDALLERASWAPDEELEYYLFRQSMAAAGMLPELALEESARVLAVGSAALMAEAGSDVRVELDGATLRVEVDVPREGADDLLRALQRVVDEAGGEVEHITSEAARILLAVRPGRSA